MENLDFSDLAWMILSMSTTTSGISLSLPLSCLFDGWRDKEQHMWAGWAELWGRRVGFTISDLPCVLLQHFFWASPNRTAGTL